MTPWIILTIVAASAAGFMLATFLHRHDRQRADEAAMDVHHDQSTEPTRKPVADGAEPAMALATGRYSVAIVMIIAGIGMVGIAGHFVSVVPPDTSSLTHPEGVQAIERLAALTAQQHPEISTGQHQPAIAQSLSGGELAPVDDMIERLAARLRQRSDDPEGWRMLGWSYFHTQRFTESAAAYLKAIELRPDSAEFRSLRGEALISAAGGTVTAEAARVLDEALTRNPRDPRARFFKGLAKAQAGEKSAALDDWIAILNAADPSEPWSAELKQKVTALSQELGVDISDRVRVRPLVAGGDLLKALANPQARARPAEAMSPVDRTVMIRGMVEGLAVRLEQSPRDVEGWIKLIRSRVVLGQVEEAKRAIDRAMTVFAGAPQEQREITSAARELGLM